MLRTFLVFLVLLIGFAIYFIIAIQISEPEIADNSALKKERTQYGDNFYKIENSFLKKNKHGLWELYVEGDGFERGAANGHLTKELANYQEEAFFKQIQLLIPDLNYLKFLKYFVAYFNRHLPDHITDEYKEEIYGISRFASDKYDFVGPKYHRILNYHGAHDIGHALQDKNMTVGCTSFGVWNDKSEDGELLIARNFDFYSGDEFAQNKIIQFTNPKRGYKFATITWAGFIGAASGMNDQGITVTINAAKSSIPTDAATPIALLAREILQFSKNTNDAIEIAKKRDVFVSESILIGSANDNKAIIIEKTPDGMDVYDAGTNEILCSNHYQGKKYALEYTNLKNQIESSSLYRKVRLKQLLQNHKQINYLEAANILRSQTGINEKNIGLGNEKAMNQLIAHHGVIFKPKSRLMWVSTNPYQCGKFVCYDLNTVFEKATEMDLQTELHIDSLTIPTDPFVYTKTYQDYVKFKNLKSYIQFITKAPGHLYLKSKFENAFIESNPKSYFTYQILGDYYKSKFNYTAAFDYYKKALVFEIATLKEENQIKKDLIYCFNRIK
ncbi:MAG TPA: C45 family autoproteolytic acyltransferase/hydrolase [Bacteroidia bacterium]|nr:C45 family autoproteolytic acyltransferase/hydrolase [Bacteroidia bacterium]